MKFKTGLLTLLIIFGILESGFPNSKNTKQLQNNNTQNKQKNITPDFFDNPENSLYREVSILKKAFPSVEFRVDYDEEIDDFMIYVTSYKKTNVFYWANGLYLPKSELPNRQKYTIVFERYNEKVLDPDDMTDEMIARIRSFSSKENRTSKYSSKFIFNGIFDSWTRRSTESHLVRNRFLGKWQSVHEMLVPHLDEIERQIYELAKTDEEVALFVKNLASADSYSWREIRDSGARSFHSYGTAIDILPYGWTKKITYWGFEKGEGNANWMLIPLSKRWMPPKKVIDIFLSEGFYWGGYWALWDNMHFEYRPDFILFGRENL